MRPARVLVAPTYVEVGMDVYAPASQAIPGANPRSGLLCTVICAAGDQARVVNERFGFDRWFPIDELRVKITIH